MDRFIWGDLYWGIWIFVLFLIPEILGWTGIAPWPTLSETAWHDETLYPVLKTLIAGFLFGLAVHIRFSTPLGHAVAGGLIIAFAAHYLWSV